jgi:orotate phosphoribosyltransferase
MASRPRDPAAETAAQILLDTRSVYVRPDPFFFSSGWASPVFVDVKRLIAFPVARTTLIELAIDKILKSAGYESFDAIAGGEVAGVPFAAMIADRMHLPLLIVRKQAKGFGPMAQVEGVVREGARVLLVEDLTTDGRSKATFCSALTRAGAAVQHAFVVFKYGIYDQVVRDLDSLGVRLFALADLFEIAAAARARGYFEPAEQEEVERFMADPVGWSEAHGGIGTGRAS